MSTESGKTGDRHTEPEAPSYTLFPDSELRRYSSEVDLLGDLQEVDIFETEHHVYRVPFRYRNVKVENWLEHNEKGIELAADTGRITIEEENAIVSVTVVGSGCSGRNYNIVEWWGPGETLRTTRASKASQLIKRQRIDNLNGQHNAWVQSALTQEPPEFQSLEEAEAFIKRLQATVYNMTSGYTMPGSLMTGLYENTAYFRIGDTLGSEHTAHKVVIRGGGLDYEDPGTRIGRYPADYAFRMIDVVVRRPVSG